MYGNRIEVVYLFSYNCKNRSKILNYIWFFCFQKHSISHVTVQSIFTFKTKFFQQYKLNFWELNVECLWTEADLQTVLSFRDSSSRRWPPFTFHIFYLWQDSSSHNDRKASLFEWRIHFPFKNSNRGLSTVDTNHVIRLKCFKHFYQKDWHYECTVENRFYIS